MFFADYLARSFVIGNAANLLWSKSAAVSSSPIYAQVSSLGNHVVRVLLSGTKEQMRRIATWTNIASMQNMKPINYGAVEYFPRQSMRRRFFGLQHLELAVAVLGDGSRPNPASALGDSFNSGLDVVTKIGDKRTTAARIGHFDTSNKGNGAGIQCWAGRAYPPFPGRSIVAWA